MPVPLERVVAQDVDGNRGYIAMRLLAEVMLNEANKGA
jgi:hypothetical protein